MQVFRKRFSFFFLIILLSLASCRLQYGEDIEADAFDKQVPDLIIVNTEYLVYRDNVLLLRMKVDRGETYSAKGTRILSGVLFEQFDRESVVQVRGTADTATQEIQTEKVEFAGNINVFILSEKTTIETDYILWDPDKKTMKGKPELKVKVVRNDGSEIEGYDLFSDLSSRSIELGGGVTGLIRSED